MNIDNFGTERTDRHRSFPSMVSWHNPSPILDWTWLGFDSKWLPCNKQLQQHTRNTRLVQYFAQSEKKHSLQPLSTAANGLHQVKNRSYSSLCEIKKLSHRCHYNTCNHSLETITNRINEEFDEGVQLQQHKQQFRPVHR